MHRIDELQWTCTTCVEVYEVIVWQPGAICIGSDGGEHGGQWYVTALCLSAADLSTYVSC